MGKATVNVVDEWEGLLGGSDREACPMCNNPARTNRANTAGTIRVTMTNDKRNT